MRGHSGQSKHISVCVSVVFVVEAQKDLFTSLPRDDKYGFPEMLLMFRSMMKRTACSRSEQFEGVLIV